MQRAESPWHAPCWLLTLAWRPRALARQACWPSAPCCPKGRAAPPPAAGLPPAWPTLFAESNPRRLRGCSRRKFPALSVCLVNARAHRRGPTYQQATNQGGHCMYRLRSRARIYPHALSGNSQGRPFVRSFRCMGPHGPDTHPPAPRKHFAGGALSQGRPCGDQICGAVG